MKREDDFRRDYGEVDVDFHRCVRRTLDELSAGQRKRAPKLRWSAVLAAALIMLGAAATAAVWNGWGMLDFLNRDGYWGGKERQSNSGAENVIMPADVMQLADDGIAVYRVEQSVCDGVYTYLTVNARAHQADVLLIDGRKVKEHSALFLNKQGLGDVMTIEEYAQQHGLKLMKIMVDGMECLDMTLNEDGSTTMLLVKCVYISTKTEPEVYVQAVSADVDAEGDTAGKRIQLQYTATPVSDVKRYTSPDVSDFEGLYPQQCRVEVIRTKVSNYAIIRWEGHVDTQDQYYFFTAAMDENVSKGATGSWADREENYEVVSFGAKEIGEELRLGLQRVTWSAPDEEGVRHSSKMEESWAVFGLQAE